MALRAVGTSCPDRVIHLPSTRPLTVTPTLPGLTADHTRLHPRLPKSSVLTNRRSADALGCPDRRSGGIGDADL
jgi:hypothetical protein